MSLLFLMANDYYKPGEDMSASSETSLPSLPACPDSQSCEDDVLSYFSSELFQESTGSSFFKKICFTISQLVLFLQMVDHILILSFP